MIEMDEIIDHKFDFNWFFMKGECMYVQGQGVGPAENRQEIPTKSSSASPWRFRQEPT